MNQDNEEKLLKIAKKRATFKVHIAIFVLTNLTMWAIWFFIRPDEADATSETLFKSFLLIFIVWTLTIVFHYFYAYVWNHTLIEKEFKKLKKSDEKKRLVINQINDNQYN